MPNIDTIYFHSNSQHIGWEISGQQYDSVCLLEKAEPDTFTICPAERHYLPQIQLKANENVLGNLIFTIAFLMIFAFVRLRGKDLLPNLLNVLVKRKKAEVILNEGISSNLVCYVLSLILSFSVISIGITYLTSGSFEIIPILYLFATFLFYHFFLLGLFKLLGWTFNARSTAAEAIVNLWTYHIMAGLLVAPFVIAIFFVKSYAVVILLNVVIFSLILFQVVKFIRWLEILFAHRVLILYMILYLCALEVMPIFILYKMTA